MRYPLEWSEWAFAFRAWLQQAFRTVHGDVNYDPDKRPLLAKAFRAGWRASVREAQRRLVEKARSGDKGLVERALLLKCEHCGKSPIEPLDTEVAGLDQEVGHAARGS